MYYYNIIADLGLEKAVSILEKRLNRRDLNRRGDGFVITLYLDPSVPLDSFDIADMTASGVSISASSLIDILGGAGAFLRGSVFGIDGLLPSTWRGRHTVECALRGVYFACHFHNYYHMAPTAEIATYIEDLALWGFNFLKLIMAKIDLNREESTESVENIDRIADIMKLAASVGMKTGLGLDTSCTYKDFPKEFMFTPLKDELGRRGNSGNVVCISKPGALEYIDNNNRFLLQALRDRGTPVDIVITWPYDEGGCGCPDCSPWAANGFIKSSKQAFATALEFYPNVLRMVSTWTFDTPPQGEWEALSHSLEENRWCDIILADAHEDYPRYPLDNGVPGNLPLVSFPEISMWGLFPWGGYGAVCLPDRFTRIWHQTGHKLYGETLYSEGIYEDINKAVIAGLCQDYNRDPDVTLAEYARYELGMIDPIPFLEIIHGLEQTHTQRVIEKKYDTETTDRIWEITQKTNSSLPTWARDGWRWRILYIRTLLEAKRFRYVAMHNSEAGYDVYAARDLECLTAMHELIDMFHCFKNGFMNDPYHDRVRPRCPEYWD